MHVYYQILYLQEVQAQCRMAELAFDALILQLTTSEPRFTVKAGEMHTAEVFRNVHSMLTHIANLSRLLWPGEKSKPNRKQRAEVLRALLELPTDGHLLSDRTLRDHLEHFDERLDSWAACSGMPPDYWQDNIGSWEVPQRSGTKERNVMRHIDPRTLIFRFQDNPWNISMMIKAVQALQQCVDAKVAHLIGSQLPDINIDIR